MRRLKLSAPRNEEVDNETEQHSLMSDACRLLGCEMDELTFSAARMGAHELEIWVEYRPAAGELLEMLPFTVEVLE